ncbi:PREDICTED: uncharacterized protein LOC108552642 isoform X2 [Eufriesea mexicana]|uniref:uncharacterized protein LOC108552642 isoform X2 n=1 Tax=Eufriesea mexicana TaxID=516756 RepID=UPI00083C2C1C|nr:PREDICTED: uncharacterized protein LOC108552642 isoform X2 [Eufriesea mexicana]
MTQNESIMTKIQKVENMLNESMYKLNILKKRLDTKLLTMQTREELETKLEEVKQELEKNEEKLKNLRRQNTKSFMYPLSSVSP